MKIKSKFFKLGLAAALSASFMATPVLAQVKVGVINSLSGTFAAFGDRYDAGLAVALEEINGSGGINGKPLELIIQDDRSDAQSALAAVESLVNQGVPMIIGSYASGITGPMSKVTTRQKIPLLVLGSADDTITKPGSDWVFRAKHNSTIVATAYVNYFKELRAANPGLKTIAIMHGNGAWPTSIMKAAVKQVEAAGFEIVGNQAYDQGATDFRPILNKFRSSNPDVLFTSSYADDGIAIARQIVEVGLKPKVVAIDTASSTVSFIEQVGNSAENIVSAVSWSPDVKYEGTPELYARLKAKTGNEPSFYEAEGYLALIIAADALRRADSIDREKVRAALKATNLKTPVTNVEFKDFDGFKGQNPIRSAIIQIQNGKHVTVSPADVAAGQAKLSN